MLEFSSKYVSIGVKKLHFYIGGSGPAILMLHPSPHTADMLLPTAKMLADNFTVICIDTPGYGKSDGFKIPPISIDEYTDLLHQFFTKMQLEKPAIYGSATGAQIAIRYAINHPGDVGQIFLDNSAHFDSELRAEVMKHYFPNLTPVSNGDHINMIWHIATNMFQYFPWCLQTEEYKLNRAQLPKEFLHGIAIDYIKAGANYHYAYKLAFEHEIGANVQQVKAPTTIFNWAGSIIIPYVEALIAHEFEDNIEVLTIPPDPNERMKIMTSHIKEKATGAPYCLSEIITITPEEKIQPTIPPNATPSITDDGSYLLEAWNTIRKEQPQLTANQIQDCLVAWYANVKTKQ